MAQLDDDAALRTALEQGRPVLPDPDFLRRHRVPHEARAGEDVLARGTPVRGAPPPHAILFSTANTTRYAIFLDASAPSRKPSLPSGKIDGRSEDGRQEAEPGLSLSAPTEGTDIIDDSPPSPSIEGEVEDDSGNTTVSTVTNSDGCGLRENLRRAYRILAVAGPACLLRALRRAAGKVRPGLEPPTLPNFSPLS